ncbi:MAG: hypothetical protein AAF358_23085 [Pseudomonadota bacterium]
MDVSLVMPMVFSWVSDGTPLLDNHSNAYGTPHQSWVLQRIVAAAGPWRMKRMMSLFLLTGLLTVWPGHAFAIERYHQLAELWGLEPIESVELVEDDVELRFWTSGFGPKGYVLSRRGGRWTALHLGEDNHSIVEALFGYRAARVEPLCNMDTVFAQLEALGVRTLAPAKHNPRCEAHPDQPCSDQITIGGGSTYVELKTAQGLISQSYSTPGLPVFANKSDDPMVYPSYRVERMHRLLGHVLGGQRVTGFEYHSEPLSLPAMVLTRATYMPGVTATLIHEYASDESGGTLHYDVQYFQEFPQGFYAWEDEESDSTVEMNWSGFRRVLVGHGTEAFRLVREENQLWAALETETAATTLTHELAIKQVTNFRDLTFLDLTSGFERNLNEQNRTNVCRRAEPLQPAESVNPITEVVVNSTPTDSKGWFVVPPVLESLKLLNVTHDRKGHLLGVRGLNIYVPNQRLAVTQRVIAPIQGSDKELLLLEPLPVPPGR